MTRLRLWGVTGRVAAGWALTGAALAGTLAPSAGTGRLVTEPTAVVVARPGAATSAAVRDPAPPDPGPAPADNPPAALPGVRQAYQCVGDTHQPAPDALPELLWAQRTLRVSQLAGLGQGAGVRVAVIDTGVARHPLLGGRLVDGGDYVIGGSGLADCDGHGTAVAGLLAGAADPVTGFSGVAPGAEVISIRQSSQSFTVPGADGGPVPAGNLDTLAEAVAHAVELGADVVNISEVACAPPNAPGAAALGAAVNAAARRGVVVVAAAGNTGGGCPDRPEPGGVVVYPAWFDDEVLAVAAAEPDGHPAPFSLPGPWVDVAAPGERLVSLAPTGSGLTDELSGVLARSALDGTSFAAPLVAGLAALIRGRYPELTARQVRDRITATAAGHGAGRTDTVGYGLVDPVAALTEAPEPVAAAAGRPRLAPRPTEPVGAGPEALWGGVLALLAAATAAALAVGRLRGRVRAPHLSRGAAGWRL